MVRAERIAHLIKRLESGYKLTTDDVNRFYNITLNSVTDLRSSQRDFKDIQHFDPRVKLVKSRGRNYLCIPKATKKILPEPTSFTNEGLSVYILKAYLSSFKDTEISKETSELIDAINKLNPGSVYSTESLFWDQNFGKYDYESHTTNINTIIQHIVEKNSVKVDYEKTTGQAPSSFRCVFRQFFQYGGSLYVVAYVPFHKNHVALKVESISKMRKVSAEEGEVIPEFNFKEFTKFRFGVFYGKTQTVVIKINKNFKHYFENRNYHETQKIYEDKGSLIINMEVPLSPELESWLMGWIDQVEVIQPDRLRKSLLKRLQAGIDNLQNRSTEEN